MKFTSRKFLIALSGVLTGIATIINGNTIEGIVAVLIAIISYLAAEGYVDSKSANNTEEIVKDIAKYLKEKSDE